jgi:hypothetical protein
LSKFPKAAGTSLGCGLWALRSTIEAFLSQIADVSYPPKNEVGVIEAIQSIPSYASTEVASQELNASFAQDAQDAAMDAYFAPRTPTTPVERASQAADGHTTSASRGVQSNKAKMREETAKRRTRED